MRSPRTAILLAVSLIAALGLAPGAAAQDAGPSVQDLGEVSGIIVAMDEHGHAGPILDAVNAIDVAVIAEDTLAVEVADPAAAIRALDGAAGVRYAEPDWPVTTLVEPPDDTHFGNLWGLRNTGQSLGTPGADIAALAAWEVWASRGVTEVVVGITDTGIDGTHPDLSTRMWRNDGSHAACPTGSTGYDFVQGQCTTDGTDPHGHGTHVAGTIGAAINNAEGVAGVAPNARLLDLRTMNASGSGTTSAAVNAVDLATELALAGVPVRVINASWETPHYSTALRDAVAAAGAAGIVLVAAAGNAASNNDVTPVYPCNLALANVICVAASTRNDGLATFSNVGATTVDLAAPGQQILSTWPGGGYQTLSGTSMAAPHVAGAAALLAGNCVSTPADITAALLDGTDAGAAFTTTTVSGGRLDAAGAFAAAGCPAELQPPGAPGPLLVGPADPVIRWSPGGGDRFHLQRSDPGANTYSTIARDLTVPEYDVSTYPEGHMDLRVAASLGNSVAVSPTATGVIIDRTRPTATLTGCPTTEVANGATVQVQVTAADGGSGLAVDPTGSHALNTSVAGTTTARFTATDRVHLSATASCTYTVTAATTGGGAPAGAPPPALDPGEPTAPDETEPTEPDGQPQPDEEPQPIDAPPLIEGETSSATALAVSQLRFPAAEPAFAQRDREPARHAVLARDDEFADALAGASLTGEGPLLLTPAGTLDPAVATELARVLPAGGRVYLLGGEHALAAGVEDAVHQLGLLPVRLAGASRIETALRVADEVSAQSGGTQVLVARAFADADNPTAAWADAISGGAYGASTATPVVLTDGGALHPAVAAWIADNQRQPILLGGTAALSGDIAAALPTATRIHGPDRAATAAAVATDLWGAASPLAAATLINGWHPQGWAHGLAAAGLAADLGAPLLVVNDTLPPATQAVLGCTQTTLIGGGGAISAEVEAALLQLCS